MINLNTIDLNLLVAFDMLISECSVSRTAERLGVTQPAVSHSLRRLRGMLNDELLVRGPRGLQPTARALSLHPSVQAVLGDLQSILSATTQFDPSITRRTFRLSMSDAVSVEVLPLIMRRLRREAPGLDLVISAGGPQESCRRIADDDLDLAIGVYPHLTKGLLSDQLYRDTLICVADRRNKKLKNGRLDLKGYLESPHVTVAKNRDTGIQLDEVLDAMGIARRIVATVPHYLSVPSLISGTDLIAHTRRQLLRVFRASVDLVVFPIPLQIKVPELEFMQIWHKRYDGDPGHRWLRELIVNTVRSTLPNDTPGQ